MVPLFPTISANSFARTPELEPTFRIFLFLKSPKKARMCLCVLGFTNTEYDIYRKVEDQFNIPSNIDDLFSIPFNK